ncbi:MAG: DUF454 family protein, partial [Oscillospiraceae bacterium]|nr:DUF454 family protein [Oscillospiraceae bacterium]
MKKLVKPFFILLGLLSLAAGTLGIFLPVLPTTPLYLLAAFCFARGSDRLHRWFLGTKLYKRRLERFVKTRSMTLKSKLTTCATVSAVMGLSFYMAPIWHARALIAAVFVFHLYYFFFRIKTIPPERAAGTVRRILSLAGGARVKVFLAVLFRWLGLLCGVAFMLALCELIGRVLQSGGGRDVPAAVILTVAAVAAAARAVFSALGNRASFAASAGIKGALREKIWEKLSALAPGATEGISAAETLQVATEGVDQMDAYFSAYLPQLFYSVAAPATLFFVILPIDPRPAAALLACAPIIPLLLVLIKRMAGRAMDRQWGSYVSLGDRFLENLQGLTTLKIYGADALRQEETARESEAFRRSTMRVLRMQLASVLVMDLAAFGGAALGVSMAVSSYRAGRAELSGALAVVLLSAEYFVPLRQLGSLFHTSMNGISASRRAFKILDLPAAPEGGIDIPDAPLGARAESVSFTYPGGEKEALSGAAVDIPPGRLTALTGVSGSGKSTLAALLSGRLRGYSGSLKTGETELRDIRPGSLKSRVTEITHDAYVFQGSIRDNLLMGRPEAEDGEMRSALES